MAKNPQVTGLFREEPRERAVRSPPPGSAQGWCLHHSLRLLGWGAVVSAVSQKGPQAGQGPSRPLGLLLDSGLQRRALQNILHALAPLCRLQLPRLLSHPTPSISVRLSVLSLCSSVISSLIHIHTCWARALLLPALAADALPGPAFCLLSPTLPDLSVFAGTWNFLVWHKLEA